MGSIVAVTDEAGAIVAEHNFDAWGRKRNPVNWTYSGVPAVPDWLYKGFTGHEQLAEFIILEMQQDGGAIGASRLGIGNYYEIKKMKFYRYIIYKLYSWAKRRPNDTPVANVILTLSVVHFIQLLTVYIITLKFIPELSIFNYNIKNIYKYAFGALFILLNYFVLYDKKRWEGYLKEFGKETRQESRKGRFYVLGYLIGSIVFFFAVVWVIYLYFPFP